MSNVTLLTKGPTIHFEQLGLRLGGNMILSDVNFSIQPGSIHCIIGPNGGGKTSLIRSMLGQMPHTGNIRICWGGATTIGYVPQSLDYDDTLPMTIMDFMAMLCQRRPAFLGLKRDNRFLIRDVLERVGMDSKINRPFGSLSGGERQRVLFAQALMPRPKLLILDEPTTGLDQAGTALMHGILEELRREGTTILCIHHDLSVVREMGDVVTCINQRLLFSGPPAEELTPERVFSVFSSVKAA